MRLNVVLFLVFLIFSVGMGQILIPNYHKDNYRSYFQKDPVSLLEALSFLEEIYRVNFAFEYSVVKGIKSPQFSPDISGDFFTDLRHVIGNSPLHYIKIGKRTIALVSKTLDPNHQEVHGRVVDADGRSLPGAEVYIENTSWGAVADDNGDYYLPDIPEGKYTLTVKYVGYRTQYQEIEVHSSDSITRNFVMHPDVLNMDEIVTIASRNPHKKIESSVAITTATASQIEERAPRSTADIFKIIPGFYVESSGGESGNNLFPRGIPQDGSYRYVAMYEDGLPVFEATELVFANIDILVRLDETIASMEGMRGGTASIYASNAPGGIINFISKTGGEKFGGLAKLSVGDYGYYRFDYNIGGPVGNNWKFNIGGFLRYDNGIRSPQFVANKGGQIKANLTRLFNNGYVRFYGKYLNDRNIFFLPIPLQNPDDPRGIPGINANYGTLTSIYEDNVTLPTPDGRLLSRKISDGIHPVVFSFTNEMAFDLGNNWSIHNASRYSKSDVTFNAIFSLDNPVPAAFFADSIKNVSSIPGFHHWEYRYSDTGQPIKNIASLNGNGMVARNGWWSVQKPLTNFINNLQLKKNFLRHKIDISAYFSTYTAGDFWYWQNILTEVKDAPHMLDLVVVDANGDVIQSITHNGFEQYGTFYVNANSEAYVSALALVDEWEVNDRFRLDIGGRYEHSLFEGRVENTNDDFTVGSGKSLAEKNVIFGNNTYRTYRYQFDEWAVSFGANYSLTPHVALYSRLGRGFRTPDFEQWIFSRQRGKSQYVHQFEGGIKLSSEKFALFGAAFFSRVSNIPFNDEVYQNDRIVKQTRFANSTTLGMEVETIWTPTDNFRLNLTGTLQNPRLRDFVAATVDKKTGKTDVMDLSGHRVRRIPSLFFYIRPTYQIGKAKIYSTWQYFGSRFVDDANTAVLPSYSIFNAGIAYDLFKNSMTITANITNVTNAVGLTEGNPRIEQVTANRQNKTFMARPVLGRTIKLTISNRF